MKSIEINLDGREEIMRQQFDELMSTVIALGNKNQTKKKSPFKRDGGLDELVTSMRAPSKDKIQRKE